MSSFYVVALYLDVIETAMRTKNPPNEKNFKVRKEF